MKSLQPVAGKRALRARISLVATALLLVKSIGVPGAEAPSAAALIERGKYLALAGNCAACHTTADGAQLAGGVAFATAFGTLYSTNITPDPQTGIGTWTVQQFQQALREGVRPDGAHLYPVFPYTSFTKVTDADAAALFAYLKSVPAASAQPPENALSFPYSQRSLLFFWKKLFFTAGAYKADAAKSAQWNRGAYLVEGLAHCSACHSPRNFLGAESSAMAMTGGVYTDKVPGDALHDWSAPNLTAASNGLGAWSVADTVAYLKTGTNPYVTTFGPMNEVIMKSTRHLADADLLAMATYLKALPANAGDLGSAPSPAVLGAGSTVYDVQCGTCHLPTGLGGPDSGPRLAGSLVVQASDPASLINIILYGAGLPQEATPPKDWKIMEAFGDKLGDDDIAALASYLRSTWGNKGGTVTAAQVAKQR